MHVVVAGTAAAKYKKYVTKKIWEMDTVFDCGYLV